MGDTFGDGEDDEKPVHEVCVDDFYMGEHEVTVGEYMDFANETRNHSPEWLEDGSKYNIRTGSDSYYKKLGKALESDNYPVVGVSWHNALAYTKWLSKKTGRTYRLPTEAEWEYAARSGEKREKFSGFSRGSEIYKYGNFCDENCGSSWKTKGQNDGYKYTAPVGSFKANKIGLYDMSGNVWEWVSDWYDKNYYRNSPKDNPKGPASGKIKVLRGGSWGDGPGIVRATDRGGGKPDARYLTYGFRIAQD